MSDIRWDILQPVDIGGQFRQGYEHAQQNALRQQEVAYQQRERARTEGLRNALTGAVNPTSGEIDYGAARRAYLGAGDVQGAIGVDTARRTGAAAALAAHRDRINFAGEAMRQHPVTDQASYAQLLGAARQAGFDVSDVPASYDPNYVAQLQQAYATLNGQVHWQSVGLGGAFATDEQGHPIAAGDPRLGGGAATPPASSAAPAAAQTAAPIAAGQTPAMPAVSALYQEFRNLGWTDEGARTMVAQIGRENGYNPDLMFGTHPDHNNGATNAGIVSWQGDRRPAFMQFMAERGFVQDGRIVPSEEALRAQAQFADQEMRQRYPESAAAVRDPNATYQNIEPVLSNNYFGWDRAGRHINAQQHLARMGDYYQATAGIGGAQQPNPMQTAQAGPPQMPGQPRSIQDQAMTGVIQAPRPVPPGFEPDPTTGGIRPQRGSQAEWERQHTASSDARQQSNINTDNARQNLQVINQVRQEFNQLPEVRDFQQSRSAVRQIERLVNSVPQGAPGRAQADMALIFSYMRALDPGNAVREGEYATAGNAASIPERIRIQYNKAVDGAQLSPEQRHGMAGAAYQTYLARATVYNERARQYHQYFRDLGVPEPGRYAPLATGPMTEERRRQQQGGPASGQTTHGVRWRVVH